MQEKERRQVFFYQEKGKSFICVVKGKHKYLFMYTPAQYHTMLQELFKTAADPNQMNLGTSGGAMFVASIDQYIRLVQQAEI